MADPSDVDFWYLKPVYPLLMRLALGYWRGKCASSCHLLAQQVSNLKLTEEKKSSMELSRKVDPRREKKTKHRVYHNLRGRTLGRDLAVRYLHRPRPVVYRFLWAMPESGKIFDARGR